MKLIDSKYIERGYKDECAWGYFSRYETAYIQARKVTLKECIDVEIEKHMLITGNEIPKVKRSERLNKNVFPDEQEIREDDSGSPIASMQLNDKGEIVSIWSYELPDEEKKVDDNNKERFEYQFFEVPYIHQKGLPIKNVITGEYGILETSKEDWDEFLKKVKNGLYVDFSDIVHTVYCLTEKGYWSHEHWNPMEMDVEMPPANDSDKKSRALVRAFHALSDYMSGNTQEHQVELVLRTTREYAEACKEMTESERKASEATCVEDILY